MKKLIVGIVLVGLSVFLIAGAAEAAHKTVHPPEGGIWRWGVVYHEDYGREVYSKYFHDSRRHRATACNASSCNRSNWEDGGRWANASIAPSFGNNRAYYDVQ